MKLLFLLLLGTVGLYAQDVAHNSVYFEFLGNGGIYSLNYERYFNEQNTLRVGFSYLDLSETILNCKTTTVPILLNQFFFSKRNQLELSAGVVFMHIPSGDFNAYKPINGASYFGFRDEDDTAHILFRLGCSQFYNTHGVRFMGGLSLGYLF
jgi:hypothetical protein